MSDIADHIAPAGLLLCNESFASTNEREGSQIAREVVRAMTDGGVKVLFVTHQFDLADGLYAARSPSSLLLRAGRGSGMRWLVSSQLYLMTTMLAYVAVRITNPDISSIRPIVTAELAGQIQQAGMSVDQFLLEFLRLVYLSVAAATLLYQGGMIIYYLRRRAPVEAAVQEAEPQ